MSKHGYRCFTIEVYYDEDTGIFSGRIPPMLDPIFFGDTEIEVLDQFYKAADELIENSKRIMKVEVE